MLDLGTELYVRSALFKVKSNRQTIMTSETWPSGDEQLAKSVTISFVQIMVDSIDLMTVNVV